MKVSQLIKELNKIPNQDARVIMCDGDFECALLEVGKVTFNTEDPYVYLEESD